MAIKLGNFGKPSSPALSPIHGISGRSPYLKALWLGLEYLAILLILGGGLVYLDKNYFDFPLGEGELGLTGDQAPKFGTFATEIKFEGAKGYAIQIAMKARERGGPATVHLFDPSGIRIFSKTLDLIFNPSLPGNGEWQKLMTPGTGEGTYRLQLIQDFPGKTKVYFFQGPFVHRLIAIPLVAGFLLLVIERKYVRSLLSFSPEGENGSKQV